MDDNVIHFPVAKRMPTRVAEEKIGKIVVFRDPGLWDENGSESQFEDWLKKRTVLFGWESVKEGIVKSFKGGRVRHLIVDVENRKSGPRVELACGFDFHPVFNWTPVETPKNVPVILLTVEQESYFRVCKKCLGSKR